MLPVFIHTCRRVVDSTGGGVEHRVMLAVNIEVEQQDRGLRRPHPNGCDIRVLNWNQEP